MTNIQEYILEKAQVLYRSKWHTIKRTADNFEYDEGMPGVALFCYRHGLNKVEFLLREEPALTKRASVVSARRVSIVTGRVDPGEEFIQTAVRELKEETGYRANEARFKDMGEIHLGKGSPVSDRFYLVNLTNCGKGQITTDGSMDEKRSRNFWVGEEKMDKHILDSSDSYLGTAYSKYRAMKA